MAGFVQVTLDIDPFDPHGERRRYGTTQPVSISELNNMVKRLSQKRKPKKPIRNAFDPLATTNTYSPWSRSNIGDGRPHRFRDQYGRPW